MGIIKYNNKRVIYHRGLKYILSEANRYFEFIGNPGYNYPATILHALILELKLNEVSPSLEGAE